jgi:formylglycine-generating enzyme required for sulfatase activity
MNFSEDELRRIAAVLRAPTHSFSELASVAGLDPACDLVGADLRGVNFRTDDLARYNFTGADLRAADFSAARLAGAIFDRTTIVDETTRWPPSGPPKFRAPPGEFWKRTAPPGFASDWGSDADGPWLEFAVPAADGTAVTQRLRWIPPGTFRMGSPKRERERELDEGPRHRVTLTRGFWLADTACTQALWQAVTGKNPSRFSGDADLPVESVSWNDVQGFLRGLESLVPGCRADLPTEAEWEYACRAGTTTPFSFGATITPEQVNYDGNFPYAGGAEGLYRRETVPVRSLPPNPWGLYEVHGNVWEWCADGRRVYDGEAQEDPRGLGPDEQTDRAVRGGCWFGLARWARSAYRFVNHPGVARDDLGFRFCLKSSAPGPAEPVLGRPGRPAEPAPGGRATRPPRDAAGRFFRRGQP